jgi:hypothetical protein
VKHSSPLVAFPEIISGAKADRMKKKFLRAGSSIDRVGRFSRKAIETKHKLFVQ